MLRRIAAQLDDQVKAVPDVSETRLIGGLRRQLRVTLDRDRLAGFGRDARERCSRRSARPTASCGWGASRGATASTWSTPATFLASAAELGQVVVGVSRGRPVYLRDVASIDDGPEEPREYVLMSGGARGRRVVGARGRGRPCRR